MASNSSYSNNISEGKTVQVKDLCFKPMIPEEQIRIIVRDIAKKISEDHKDSNPIFIIMLNGAFMFAADLLRELDFVAETEFVKYSSYDGTETSGTVKCEISISENKIKGRDIIIIEDIVETGLTMREFIKDLQKHSPKSISIATMFLKEDKLKIDLPVKYIGKKIGNDFIVGYGLDYDGTGRNIPCVYVLNK